MFTRSQARARAQSQAASLATEEESIHSHECPPVGVPAGHQNWAMSDMIALFQCPNYHPVQQYHRVLIEQLDNTNWSGAQAQGGGESKKCFACMEDVYAHYSVTLDCNETHILCCVCLTRRFLMMLDSQADGPPKCCGMHIPLSKDVRMLLSTVFYHFHKQGGQPRIPGLSPDKAEESFIHLPVLRRFEYLLKRQARILGSEHPIKCNACGEWVDHIGENIQHATNTATCEDPLCRAKTCMICNQQAHDDGKCPDDKNLEALQVASEWSAALPEM
jgi:hypothetical protein